MHTDKRKKYSQRRKGKTNGLYSSLVDIIKVGLAAGSQRAYSHEAISGVSGRLVTTSLESLEMDGSDAGAEAVEAVDEAASDVVEDVTQVITDHGGDIDTITDAQKEALVESIIAVTSAEAYMSGRLSTSPGKVNRDESDYFTSRVVAAPGGFDYGHAAFGMEAFDASALGDYAAASAVFNFAAAKQDDFGEAYYPTQVLTTDKNALELNLRRTMVLNQVRHSLSGQVTDYDRRNIIDAFIDYTVLADEITNIIPNYCDEVDTAGKAVGDNNTQFFVPGFPRKDVLTHGVNIKTAPLKIGVNVDLKGISQNAGLNVGGQLDQNDSIDGAINLSTLVFAVGEEKAAGDNLIEVPVDGLQYTQFLQAGQGQSRRVECQFRSDDIVLTGETLNSLEVVTPNLEYLATDPRSNWVVRLNVNTSFSVDLETGKTTSSVSEVSIAQVFSIDPATNTHEVITDSVELQALSAALGDIVAVGYTLKARRTNHGRRELGKIVTVYEEMVRYVVPLGSPIVIHTPLTDVRTNVDLSAPVAAVRARNSNNAVTQLLRFRDQLKAIKPLLNSSDRSIKAPCIEGIGHTVVYPTYEHVDLNLLGQVQGIRSQDRFEDVRATVVNNIRDMAYRMHLNSGYEVAALALEGVTTKPILVIGTDPYVLNHLQLVGDTRLLGVGFDFKIVSTMDLRVRNKIFMTLTQPHNGQPSPLLFGTMAWINELITTLKTPRNGNLVNETMVQPRTLHVNFCPILGEIDVTGLGQAVTTKLVQDVNFVA